MNLSPGSKWLVNKWNFFSSVIFVPINKPISFSFIDVDVEINDGVSPFRPGVILIEDNDDSDCVDCCGVGSGSAGCCGVGSGSANCCSVDSRWDDCCWIDSGWFDPLKPKFF